MAEAGVAYVSIVPTTKGMGSALTSAMRSDLDRPMREAGDRAGASMSDGISSGVTKGGGIKNAAAKVGDVFKTALKTAGIAAGVALAVGISSGLDQGDQEAKFVAQMGGGERAAELGKLAGTLWANNFGESTAEAGEAIQRVMRSGLVMEDASGPVIEEMTERLLTFTDVMEQDMDMATQAVARMMRTGIADSADEAFDILTAGIQRGGDESGDLLETFQEYSTIFRELGLSGEEAMGLMLQGLSGGARDLDKTADALKEFSIQAQSGSARAAEGFEALGLNAAEMTARFAEGGPVAQESLGMVLDALDAIEDPTLKNTASVALFGTQFEDLGEALAAMDLDTAEAMLGDFSGSTDALGEAYNTAGNRIETFKRQALKGLTDFVGGQVIPLVERLAEVVGPHLKAAFDDIGPIIDQVGLGLNAFISALQGEGITSGGFVGFMERLGVEMLKVRDAATEFWAQIQPIFAELESRGVTMGHVLGALAAVIGGALVVALVALVAPLVAAVAPFVAAGVAIAAIGAAFVYLYQEVDSFRAFADEVLPKLSELFSSTMELITTAVSLAVETIKWVWKNFGDEIVRTAEIAWGLISGVVNGALDVVLGVIQGVTALMKGDWQGALDAMGRVASGWKTIVSAIFKAALSLIRVAFSAGFKAIRLILEAAMKAMVRYARSKLDELIGFFRSIPGRVRGAFSTLASAISAPFRAAFRGIKNAWNSLVGGFSFSMPSWIPGVGGNSFSIPRMHTGGIFDPSRGNEGLALLERGEAVFTPEQTRALGVAVNQPTAAGSTVILDVQPGSDQYFERWIRNVVRTRYQGNVQTAFGS